MTKFSWIVLLPAISCLISCTDLKKSERLSKIDRLSNDLESVMKRIDQDETDTSFLLSRIEYAYSIVYAIEDTISKSTMYQLDSLRQFKNDLEERNAIFNFLKLQIPKQIEELDKLKKDIQNDFGQRERYDDYVSAEAERKDSILIFFERFNALNKSLSSDYLDFINGFTKNLDIGTLERE